MTTVNEWSDAFDTVVDSYRRFKDFDKREMLDSIEFDEYEKSMFLTMAQTEVVIGLYTGKNTYGEPFEDTEEMRRYLESLVKTAQPSQSSTGNPTGVSATSVFYTLPSDIAFIVYEQASMIDSALGCYDGTVTDVRPVTHDEYNRVRRNPFRGATRYKVLRLDAGNNKVELVSKYHIDGYMIRYLVKPEPIILEDLDNGLSIEGETTAQPCQLNEMLHKPILNRAVQLALASKGIQVN